MIVNVSTLFATEEFKYLTSEHFIFKLTLTLECVQPNIMLNPT